MVNKKAQVKTQETAFMLMGLTLFFIFAGLFVLSFYFSGLKEEKKNLDEENAGLLVSKLANFPELSCGNSFGRGKTNCVDLDKLMVFKNRILDYKDFFNIFGIEVIKINNSKNQIECSSKNYPDCNRLTITLISGKNLGIDKSSFVLICHKEKWESTFYDKCEIGKLIVRFGNE